MCATAHTWAFVLAQSGGDYAPPLGVILQLPDLQCTGNLEGSDAR